MQDEVKRDFPLLPKIIIFFTIFLDALGIGFITPVLPYYVESFDVPKIVVTSLFAVFSIFAFFSAPILGMISDRRGRRPVLLISLLSSAIGWIIFAFSKNIFGLFLGRIIDGAAAGNISTAQNYLVDISKDQKDLARNLGWVGGIFGIGFIIGPLASGILFAFNKRLPFIVVALMAVINTLLAYFFLPETNGHKSEKKISINPFAPIVKAFKNKKLLPLYLAWLFFGISIALSQAILGLYVDAIFSWRAITAGLVMTMIGVIIFVNQVFLTHKVWLKYFKESVLMVFMIIPFALGFFIMALPFKFAFILGIIMAGFAYSTLRIITNSQVLGLCEKEEQGETMGILASLISFSLILGPMIGGSAYEISSGLPFILTGTLLAITFIFIFNTYKRIMPKGHEHNPEETINIT